MGLINNIRSAFGSRTRNSASPSKQQEHLNAPLVEYVDELSKSIVKNTSSAQIERIGNYGVITYAGEQSTRRPVRNSILGGNLTRSNATKFTLVSDYDLARVERFYEKEGMLRRFVVTATARAMRGEFALIDNPAYTGPEKDKATMRTALRKVLKESRTTWNTVIQTSLKELFTYGNTFIRKYRKDKVLSSILLDDPLFYRVAIDPKTLQPSSFVRQSRLRPRAWSEDTYKHHHNHVGMYPQFQQSDYTGRKYLRAAGYYGSTIAAAPAPENLKLDDVVHVRYLVEKNAPLAMPPSMPALNDIEDMRVLEENMVFLGWQFGHPILVATVDCTGMTQTEAQAEIDRTRASIDNMESIGFIVGTQRLKIELKYPNGSGVPLDSFISYFNKRIATNADTAALLMGNGGDAGRQAGEAIEASSNDIIWMICNMLAESLEEGILRDLWEGISGKESGEELPLKIRLVEIDRTRYTAYVNQLNNLVNALVVPGSRLLSRIGEKPLTPQEKAEVEEYAMLRATKPPTTVNPQNQHGEQTPGSKKN